METGDYNKANKDGYGKRPYWQWILIYLAIGAVVYGVYYFVFANKGNYNAPSATQTNQQSPQATNSVTIQNMSFSPASITVKKGDTITWTNQDAVGHNVTETDGKTGPNSSTLNQGKTYSFTFNEIGTFSYNCSLHPYMTGSVTVTQ